MNLGISSYTYTWATGVPGYEAPAQKLTPQGLVRLAHEKGVSVVQICDNMPLDGLSDAELGDLRNLAEQLGIVIEVGTRKISPGNLKRHLEIARVLGSSLLRVLLLDEGGEIGMDQAYAYLKDFCQSGICIAIENHDGHKVAELAGLVQRLNSPYIGICLDTVNSFGALEAPDTVIDTLLPLTVNLHVKDFVIERLDHKMGFQIRGCAAGQGRLDVPAILPRLKQLGRDPSVILELWTPWQGAIEQTVALERQWANESILYLKNVLAEVK